VSASATSATTKTARPRCLGATLASSLAWLVSGAEDPQPLTLHAGITPTTRATTHVNRPEKSRTLALTPTAARPGMSGGASEMMMRIVLEATNNPSRHPNAAMVSVSDSN
jgi:hypothetical protein